MFRFTPGCCCEPLGPYVCGDAHGLQLNGPTKDMEAYFDYLYNDPDALGDPRDYAYQGLVQYRSLNFNLQDFEYPLPSELYLYVDLREGNYQSDGKPPLSFANSGTFVAAYNINCAPLPAVVNNYFARVRPWSRFNFTNGATYHPSGSSTSYVFFDIAIDWKEFNPRNAEWWNGFEFNHYNISRAYPDFDAEYSAFGYTILGTVLAYEYANSPTRPGVVYYTSCINKIKQLILAQDSSFDFSQLGALSEMFRVGMFRDDKRSFRQRINNPFNYSIGSGQYGHCSMSPSGEVFINSVPSVLDINHLDGITYTQLENDTMGSAGATWSLKLCVQVLNRNVETVLNAINNKYIDMPTNINCSAPYDSSNYGGSAHDTDDCWEVLGVAMCFTTISF